MARQDKPTIHDYIRSRVAQLKTESLKCSDPRDKQWYERMAQELQWCQLYSESRRKEDK